MKTPHLDALSRRGFCLDRMRTMSGLHPAVCMPSRAATLTGLPPWQAFETNGPAWEVPPNRIAPGLVTMPEHFRQSGYHTHFVGKWHCDHQSLQRAFQSAGPVWDGARSLPHSHIDPWYHDFHPDAEEPVGPPRQFRGFSSEIFADATIDFLSNRADTEEPFFCYTGFFAPHDPRTPPPDFQGDPEAIDLPPNYAPMHPFDNGELKIRDEMLAPHPRPERHIRLHLDDYHGMIAHLDAQVGRILAALDETGQRDNTLIVYTADHGLAVGSHGLMGKQNCYEHSLRIPFILSGPGVPEGQGSEAPAQQYDVFPTLCDLAGLDLPRGLAGQSFGPVIYGERQTIRPHAFGGYRHCQRYICGSCHKLIRYFQRDGEQLSCWKEQLFDLEADPWETHDLVEQEDRAEILQELRAALRSNLEASQDPLLRNSA